MRFLHLSDTHSLHRQLIDLPKADIIIHSGDMSMVGTGSEVLDFIEWFSELDYKYKIFIGGNHDFGLENKNPDTIQDFLPDNCFYLCNSGVTIKEIKFWGVPFFFADDVSGDYFKMIAQIPTDTDVLITHRPPLGILDFVDNINYGCSDLLDAVSNIRPQYNLFGHIHDSYGIEKSEHTTFINATVVDANYQLKNEPFVFEV